MPIDGANRSWRFFHQKFGVCDGQGWDSISSVYRPLIRHKRGGGGAMEVTKSRRFFDVSPRKIEGNDPIWWKKMTFCFCRWVGWLNQPSRLEVAFIYLLPLSCLMSSSRQFFRVAIRQASFVPLLHGGSASWLQGLEIGSGDLDGLALQNFMVNPGHSQVIAGVVLLVSLFCRNADWSNLIFQYVMRSFKVNFDYLVILDLHIARCKLVSLPTVLIHQRSWRWSSLHLKSTGLSQNTPWVGSW